MPQVVNGDMLRIARQFRGFNQRDLAELIGVEASTVSRAENGIVQPSDATIAKTADTLRFPAEFFYLPDRVYGLPISSHPMWRKKKAVTQRDADAVLAELNIRILHLRRLLRSLEFAPKLPLPRYEVDDHEGDVDKIAGMIRRAWMLPAGPLVNLTAAVEAAGVFVFHIDLERSDIDGVTISAPDLPPCVFLNKQLLADRMRFTLAHELGHIILHRYPTESMEDEANHFAGALLMPRNDIHNYFVGQKIDLRFLARMKPVWRASMQNIAYRAHRLGYITKVQNQYLWRQFNYHKMRMREPAELDIEPEAPTLVPTLFELHIKKLGYTWENMQAFLCMALDDLRRMYGMPGGGQRPSLRVVS
jgi:Zn-dependent peptidase ImmA (M78 family)/transcriptional regulator with XRE-family HTH domain